MNKLIFTCVFNKKGYVDLCFLLLESLFIYGNMDHNTHILIYTSTEFKDLIQKSHLYNEKIRFEINDNYNDVDSACKARLDLFSFKVTSNYDKILYIDADTVIKGPVDSIFNIIEKDILYAGKDGSIDDPQNYWGQSLFGEEVNNYEDKSAFSSGIMLFNNCTNIKFLFEKIKEDMATRTHFFHDQPFVVYNAFKYNLYDNNKLLEVTTTHNEDINSQYVLHHYPIGVSNDTDKLAVIKNFLFQKKDETIVNIINRCKAFINEHLLSIIFNCGELLEGNIFMIHNTFQYTNVFENKVKNIVSLLLNQNINSVLEIGFNSGFSALLMLMTNPNITLTCVDLGNHMYTVPCYEKIKEFYGDRINLIIGNSVNTLPNLTDCYDLIHIDGGHDDFVATNDIVNCYHLSKNRTILIMDDYDFTNLHALWNSYIDLYKLKPLDIQLYDSPHHDIKYLEKI